MRKGEQHSVLLDTSFFIRLLNEEDPLHENALGYFRYFLEYGFCLKISTIAIAEFCVKGEATDLPLRNLQILPFNYNHAIIAGKFINVVHSKKNEQQVEIKPRTVVPNDSKMFAQAECEPDIEYFASSDTEATKVIKLLKEEWSLSFRFIDINIPYSTFFGELDFKE